MDRLNLAQQLILIMDRLLKENNMSLIIKEGKPVIMDHEVDRIYKIEFGED